MDLPLQDLQDAHLGPLTLSVTVDKKVPRPHPFSLTAREETGEAHVLLEGRTNPGTRWRHPWLEARYQAPPGPESLEEELWSQLLPTVLVPASYLMISCDGFPETLSALSVGVPPLATHVGHLLWQAGARWYKVWYYPEGWREGNEKLQGNLPPNPEHRAKAETSLLADLEAFLKGDLAEEHPACAHRARQLLDVAPPKG